MLLPFVIVEFCPEQNINTIGDITLQPLSVYPHVFGGASIVSTDSLDF